MAVPQRAAEKAFNPWEGAVIIKAINSLRQLCLTKNQMLNRIIAAAICVKAFEP